MATKNIVPRADLEGGIGTDSKKWASGSFGRVNVSSYVSGSGASTASFGTYRGDGSQLTGITSGIFQTTGSVEATTNNLQVTGSVTVSSTGSFGRLEIAGDSNLIGNLTIGGNIQIGDSSSDSITISADLTSHLIPNSDSSFDLGSSIKNWRVGYIEQIVGTSVTTTGNISGSATSTGSFGEINSAGRIFEQGTSVIDHATAMAIVFGG